jgi:hypothetical protein
MYPSSVGKEAVPALSRWSTKEKSYPGSITENIPMKGRTMSAGKTWDWTTAKRRT